jgi:hypothetical protein
MPNLVPNSEQSINLSFVLQELVVRKAQAVEYLSQHHGLQVGLGIDEIVRNHHWKTAELDRSLHEFTISGEPMEFAVVGKSVLKFSTLTTRIPKLSEEPRPTRRRNRGSSLIAGDLFNIDRGSIEIERELTKTLKVCVKNENNSAAVLVLLVRPKKHRPSVLEETDLFLTPRQLRLQLCTEIGEIHTTSVTA